MRRARQRIAVIGVGLASAPHLTSLIELADEVDVGWIVANTQNRLQTVAEKFPSANTSTSLSPVLEDESIVAALVLTPPNSHLELVARLAAAGKHILVEKPLELNSARASELVATCKRHGVQLSAVLQHRMRPGALALAEAVSRGTLGEITNAAVEVRWWRPQDYYDEPGRGTFARDGGGVLMTQAIHTLDLFLWIAGMPQHVSAFSTTTSTHQMECEDAAAAVLRFANGAIATVNATTAAYPGFSERIEISGTNGSASLIGGQLTLHLLSGEKRSTGEEIALGAGADPMAFPHMSHKEIIVDFLDAIRTGKPPRITGESALHVHVLIELILKSARTGTTARWPSA